MYMNMHVHVCIHVCRTKLHVCMWYLHVHVQCTRKLSCCLVEHANANAAASIDVGTHERSKQEGPMHTVTCSIEIKRLMSHSTASD